MKILNAFKLAATLHAGQEDKVGRPYIEHLSRVFVRVIEQGGDRDQQLAALLHDAIEDGHVSEEGLLQAGVPWAAVELIAVLTRRPGQSYADYIQSILKREKAILIKRCDLADNLDGERLSLLNVEVADRLRSKYGSALSVLAGVH